MSTRIRILVALVAILVLVSLPASAAATPRARAAGACPGNVLDRVSGGELSEQIVGHDEGPETELMHLCSSTSNRSYTFPEGPEGDSYSFFYAGLAFAGSETAALAWAWVGHTPQLWVVSLVTHKLLFKKTLPEDSADPETIFVGKLVLQRDGAVAWTQTSKSGACEVIEHTSKGTHVLNPTRKAQPESLTLTGTTLHWSEGEGQTRTATLR
jgi:hypothetical protein